MPPKGLCVIRLAGGLLVAGCGKPRTEWRITFESSGICGTGIETKRQAKQAMLKGSATTLTSIFAEERLWTDYVNADPNQPKLSLEDFRITPRKIDEDGHVVLKLTFAKQTSLDGADEALVRARIERAVKNYARDNWRQEGQRAIADLRARQLAAAAKTDAASLELARQLEQRIAEVETQMRQIAGEDVIRLTITDA